MTRQSRSGALGRQHGNTLSGIIIGLIIGLVIAVVVALAIKGNNPFSDKPVKIGKMSEPTVGQAADPNKPMYGNKEAARAANKQFDKKSDEAAPDGPAASPAATAAAAETPKAAEAKPAEAKSEGEGKTVFYLQAGAFRETADAENTRAKLALLGFEAAISELESPSGVLHRVRIGPYSQAETMNKARAKLIDSGIDVAIVRNTK